MHKIVYEGLNHLLWEGFRSWVLEFHSNDTNSVHSTMELLDDLCAGVSPDLFLETPNLPSVSRAFVLFNDYKNDLAT